MNLPQIFVPPKRFSPIKSALLALFLGPIVMSAMYFYMVFISHSAIDERGLFSFYSASYGDFIILPICWAFMSKYYSIIKTRYKWQSSNVDMYLAIIVGAVFTIFVVGNGMLGDNRDWTLPIKGAINFPGIYHALFMALMITSFVMYFLEHWRISNFAFEHDANYQIKFYQLSTLFWTVINLLTGFFVLLWMDSLYDGQGYFLEADPLQELVWMVFLLVNFWQTIRLKQKPYRGLGKWGFIQLAWWLLLSMLVRLLI